MSALARLQREFLAAIFEAGPPRDPGVAIYRRNVFGALHGALAASHPVTLRLVGEAFFREAADRFAHCVPSRSGNLHDFGGGFADFLGTYEHARHLAWLPGVARLEWAVHECAHADDGAAPDLAALARVPEARQGDIRLRLHPAARLVESRHPILAIWQANQPGRDGVPDRDAGPDRVLVRREGHGAHPCALEQSDWDLLAALARGATLDQACVAMGAAADRLADALARHAAAGVIGGFDADCAP